MGKKKIGDPIVQAAYEAARQVTLDTAEACRRELALAKHELPLDRKWAFDVKVSFAEGRRRSIAYDDGISMALAPLAPTVPWKFSWFPEYARIDGDPCIGGLASPDWRHAVQAITAHEVAHVAQGQIRCKPARLRGRMARTDLRTPHGEGWRRLYAILRAALVNPAIKEAGGRIGGVRGGSRHDEPWGLPTLNAIHAGSGFMFRRLYTLETHVHI